MSYHHYKPLSKPLRESFQQRSKTYWARVLYTIISDHESWGPWPTRPTSFVRIFNGVLPSDQPFIGWIIHKNRNDNSQKKTSERHLEGNSPRHDTIESFKLRIDKWIAESFLKNRTHKTSNIWNMGFSIAKGLAYSNNLGLKKNSRAPPWKSIQRQSEQEGTLWIIGGHSDSTIEPAILVFISTWVCPTMVYPGNWSIFPCQWLYSNLDG